MAFFASLDLSSIVIKIQRLLNLAIALFGIWAIGFEIYLKYGACHL
jgi:hypothetical protein